MSYVTNEKVDKVLEVMEKFSFMTYGLMVGFTVGVLFDTLLKNK